MNYFDCKKLKRMIDKQRLEVAELRCRSASISVSIDGMPHSGYVDRVGLSVGQIISEEEKLNALYDQLTEGIKSIPDEYIKTLIHCKIVKGWSWTRIAQEIGGSNTGDTVRMQCVRYRW